MKRTLAGLGLVIAVAAAGVWAVASMIPPTSTPEREPALVVPAAGTPTPATTPSALPITTATPSGTPATQAPGTASAPQPSYYDDDDHDDDKGGNRDDDKDDDD